MKKILSTFLLIFLIALLTACSSDSANNDAKQADNQDETTNSKEDSNLKTSERIISTTVAITEIMDELELDLVGVPSSYKDLPERYEGATEVGNPMDPDLEVVLSLKPDNVLSVTNLQADLEEKFTNGNVPATFLDLDSVGAMFDEIIALGEKYDREEQAQRLVDNFDEKMAEVEKSVEGKEAPTVLILMGIPGSYIVGTEHSYIGDLVKRAGGEIAVTGHSEDYISANTEYLQQTNPDIILRAAHGAPEEVVKMFDREFEENDIWKHFKAVQDGRVYDLEETRFGTTANLAVIEAMDELVSILYPEN